MEDKDLLRMSKQMASFFAPYPTEKAIEGVLDHLKKFWDPRMREQLLAILENQPDQLDPLVLKAAQRLAAG